jgi:hypothetical protein
LTSCVHGADRGRNYNPSMDAREGALAVVRAWRTQIDTAVSAGATASLSSVLSRPDVGHAYVVKVLDVHPCLGKVAGRRLMARVGVGPRVRIGELSPGARAQLESECRCPGA